MESEVTTKPESPPEIGVAEHAEYPDERPDTLSGEPLREVGSDDDDRERPTRTEAVKEAAEGKALSPVATQSALDWFMSDIPDEASKETKDKVLNFGTSDEPQWVTWKIGPIAGDVLRAIRRRAQTNREARRTGISDNDAVNLEIVVEATIEPDIKAATRQMYEAGKLKTNDPAEALRLRFQAKPGYITQIAGDILGMSGFDEADVQDSTALDAAKN